MILKAILYLLLSIALLLITPIAAFFMALEWAFQRDFGLKDYLRTIGRLFYDGDNSQFKETFKKEVLFL